MDLWAFLLGIFAALAGVVAESRWRRSRYWLVRKGREQDFVREWTKDRVAGPATLRERYPDRVTEPDAALLELFHRQERTVWEYAGVLQASRRAAGLPPYARAPSLVEWCHRTRARVAELEAEACRFYRADGTFEVLPPEAVVERRILAARRADHQAWVGGMVLGIAEGAPGWEDVVEYPAGHEKAEGAPAIAAVKELRRRFEELEARYMVGAPS